MVIHIHNKVYIIPLEDIEKEQIEFKRDLGCIKGGGPKR